MRLPDGTSGWADFSPDRTRRYALTRSWDASSARRHVLWVMLNPSTANASTDDRTIRRACSFARSWGGGGITVVSLYSLVSVRPAGLADEPDQLTDDESRAVRCAVGSSRVGLVVAAWGNAYPLRRASMGGEVLWPGRQRAQEISDVAHQEGLAVYCLATNANGSPRHPLYVRGDPAPQVWPRRPTW